MSTIVEGAAAKAALLDGIERMTRLLRPTLGPLSRTVAVSSFARTQPPEILDSGAMIARRTVQIPDHFVDMGAMMVRHLVWRVFNQVGDGTATAAVLAEALVRGAMRNSLAGANPVGINRGMQRGHEVIRAALLDAAQPIDAPSDIAGVVAGIVGSPTLARMIGEAVDAVGVDGTILVEEAKSTTTTLTYAEGMRWNEGYVSPYFAQAAEALVRLTNPRILVTDYPLDRPEQLVPVLEACLKLGERNLFIVAPAIRDSAVAVLLANRDRGVLDGVLGVRAPLTDPQRAHILEDIATATGGRSILQQTHFSIADVTSHDLGKARQAWATHNQFGLVGAYGDKTAVRQRIAAVRAELDTAEDEPTRRIIQERIGKLAGVAATIHVGAAAPSAREEMKVRVESAVRAARLALCDGVVPGGGVALLGCIPYLEAMHLGADEDIGVKALAVALAEPMRAIVANAGFETEPIVCEARQRAGREVFDVLRRGWRDPWQACLLDPVDVVLTALACSVSLATSALTADVLVHRKHAAPSKTP